MRIAYITAGAAGMFCGSCMHDNTLVAALLAQGHDALLIPTYTPIRTDEADVSQQRVFFGGINVYLQQKSALFRHTPWFLDRLLDFPGLLRWVSRFAVKTQAEQLGELTLSMLKGEHGHQGKEIAKLVRFLQSEFSPRSSCSPMCCCPAWFPPSERISKCRSWACCRGTTFFWKCCPTNTAGPPWTSSAPTANISPASSRPATTMPISWPATSACRATRSTSFIPA